jgi:hypothetical protein
LKIIESTLYYYSENKFSTVHENARWLYLIRTQNKDYVQFDVDQDMQYVSNDGTYLEFVENNIDFMQMSPVEPIHV